MRKRLIHMLGAVLLAVSVTLVIWQGSFHFGEFAPASIEQTYLFWAVSTLIFLLMVTLGFMLFRTGVKLYIERQANRDGTGLKTKMVIGALALSFIPVFFLVLFSFSVLNRNLDKWFSRPAVNVRENLIGVSVSFERQAQQKADAQAHWLALLPETRRYLETGVLDAAFFEPLCAAQNISRAELVRTDGKRMTICSLPDDRPEQAAPAAASPRRYVASAPVVIQGDGGEVVVANPLPFDLAERQRVIEANIAEYDRLTENQKSTRSAYLMLLALITLFVLFVATWIALFLARLINVPISALLAAAEQVRRGNMTYRIRVQAIDELASLVHAFNQMTEDLETKGEELKRRQHFIEAILDNIPSGVISVSTDGRIQRVNAALRRIFPDDEVGRAVMLRDLFPAEDGADLQYLMNRARRTGVASRQFECKRGQRPIHLSVTVSALETRAPTGFVVVIEDTTELLRAQKATAWREVARRIAHEIKNPLTPITLCAQRISRQVERAGGFEGPPSPEFARILRECSGTIFQEAQTVRNLVDEFAQFARFPAAQPAPTDLNEVVNSALAVFDNRLAGIDVIRELDGALPPVHIDREQFKRVIVNLVDNSAEAMLASPVRRLYVGTRAAGADAVELVVADTGCGVSQEDREKLFLPYFSTKNRGTGLGLAIVNHVVSDHGAQIRVEDNSPAGTRFIIEIPVQPAVPVVSGQTVGSPA